MFASKDLFFSRPSGYQISRSVRLRSSATAYFNRTPASTTNQQKWTLSFWVKRGALSVASKPFAWGTSGTEMGFQFRADNGVEFYQYASSAYTWVLDTTAVYRDPSAWYHFVLSVDTTQATSTNRLAMYVNGSQVTSFSTATYPSLNLNTYANSTSYAAMIGNLTGQSQYLDGYLTEINFIDGQQLTPSSFGQTNSVTSVWQPIKYAGTYGTNGFYLNFSDNSNNTATTIGKDYSGNGNNWTPNNISVTAGVTYDSMIDVPTPYADGGNGRGNYAVLNPVFAGTSGVLNGNLDLGLATAMIARSTMLMTTGKWYSEFTMVSAGANSARVGITGEFYSGTATYLGADSTSFGYAQVDGKVYNNAGTPATYATYANGDIIGLAYNADTRDLSFYKNGTLQGTFTSSLIPSENYYFAVEVANSTPTGWACNFGQRPFTYTPPSGYVALNTQNLPTPTISNGANYMAATTYAGSASQQIINSNLTSLNFAWIKDRTSARSHVLVDTVRGGSPMLTLYSDLTAAEDNTSPNYNPTSISGSSITLAGAKLGINNSGENYVMWGWSAGSSNVTNTSGSITSTVSVNATAGFSIATFTSTGAAATVGHGLGVAPSMIIVKARNNVSGWPVYHASIGNTGALRLDQTAATSTSIDWWRNTSPTSSVFSIGANFPNAYTEVAYCFSAVAGYSAFGSYTGNGSADGSFVYCGFRPRWLMIKNASTGVDNWVIEDSSRDTYNPEQSILIPNTSGAESVNAVFNVDFLSNGFKLRGTSTSFNGNGNTFIFACFAENPFKNALAR